MLGISEDIAERVLNHSRGEIVGTDDLFEFIPQKRVALEKLAAWLGSLLARSAPCPGARELIHGSTAASARPSGCAAEAFAAR
jgi:hypothetical protein